MLAPDSGAVERLRDALHAADYRVDPVADLLGPVASAALGRHETTPAVRATAGGGPLATLVRLWLLQRAVPAVDLAGALPGLVEPLLAGGLLSRAGEEVRAVVDVRPYAVDGGDRWLVSDLTPGLDAAPAGVGPDHVLGLSQAATSLAQLVPRRRVRRALDLGSGCGVQALHLTDHADAVVATDVNPRAVALTRLTARLNGVAVDVRTGDRFAPVTGERFDLVTSNPPFVVGPGAGDRDEPRLVYRDAGLPGDAFVREVVRGAAGHLAPDGVAVVLANWVHREGEPWQERLAGWVAGLGCDAWAVQRDVSDPAAYVELWLRDAGAERRPGYTAAYDAWLDWFARERVHGVGYGWLVLRRTPHRPVVRLEEWPHAVEQPLGPEVDRWLAAVALLRDASDGDLLERRWRHRADLTQETSGPPGAADPESVVLRQHRGLRRARAVDTAAAALVGASDGDLAHVQLLRAVSQVLDVPEADLLGRAAPELRALVEEGYLEPAEGWSRRDRG